MSCWWCRTSSKCPMSCWAAGRVVWNCPWPRPGPQCCWRWTADIHWGLSCLGRCSPVAYNGRWPEEWYDSHDSRRGKTRTVSPDQTFSNPSGLEFLPAGLLWSCINLTHDVLFFLHVFGHILGLGFLNHFTSHESFCHDSLRRTRAMWAIGIGPSCTCRIFIVR